MKSALEGMSAVDHHYSAVHANVFAILFNVLGYPPAERGYHSRPSPLSARGVDGARRTFFSGDISGPFDGGVYPFDQAAVARRLLLAKNEKLC